MLLLWLHALLLWLLTAAVGGWKDRMLPTCSTGGVQTKGWHVYA
jgi:hypothetical protein